MSEEASTGEPHDLGTVHRFGAGQGGQRLAAIAGQQQPGQLLTKPAAAASSRLPMPGHGPADSLVGFTDGARCGGTVTEQAGRRSREDGHVPQEAGQRQLPRLRAQSADPWLR